MKRKLKKEDFQKLKKAEYEKIAERKYIEVTDDSEILVLRSWAKKENQHNYKLFVVAGWSSIVLGWDEFLMEAQEDFDIVYIETREKSSSKISKKSEYTLDRMSSDIKDVMEKLGLNQKKVVVCSSSVGSLIVADALAKDKIDPNKTILMFPPVELKIPFIFRFLGSILPPFLFNLIKPLAKFWIRNFKAESEEQEAKISRVLDEADAFKWKKLGLPLTQKNFGKLYKKIDNEILTVGANDDRLHDTKTTKQISSMMPNSKFLDIGSNKKAHSTRMVKTIREFLGRK